MTDVIEEGKVVFIHYTLKNDEGEVLDSSEGEEPLFYLHGAQNIVPGLENELTGKKVGDKLDVVVAPEDGYGEHMEGAVQEFARDVFPEDVDLEPEMVFHAQTPDGHMVPFWVKEVGEETVIMDGNHPLAGVTLNFAVEVTRIRPANEDELAHGHPHGPEGNEGHHH